MLGDRLGDRLRWARDLRRRIAQGEAPTVSELAACARAIRDGDQLATLCDRAANPGRHQVRSFLELVALLDGRGRESRRQLPATGD